MIKKIYFSAALISCASLAFGQVGANKIIGRSTDMAKSINSFTQAAIDKQDAGASFMLPTPAGTNLSGIVNLKSEENGQVLIAGAAGNKGTFNLKSDASGTISGFFYSIKDRTAYTYSTEAGNVVAKAVAIESMLCMDYAQAPITAAQQAEYDKLPARTTAIPKFESKPGASKVIYIDLDGEVSKSPGWAGGATINAQPIKAFTDAEVEAIWEVTAQDYLTFDVNVTTDRSVYDAAASCSKKMAIVTKTYDAANGQAIGGIAHVSSFGNSSQYNCSADPCWVYNFTIPKVTGETVSHEVGHTVGMNHDGINSTEYYQGHSNWAPIMGAVYSTGTTKIDDANAVGQWSKGEYSGATNTQNDLSVISGFLGTRADDFGNTYQTASALTVETDGSVLPEKNQGIITTSGTSGDKDVFKFTCAAGDLNISVTPYQKKPVLDKFPNLNVQLRLLNSSGTELAIDGNTSVTPNTYVGMNATISKTGLAAGTYYLEIDGVGNGTNASTGYTDYGSVGGFIISGTTPKPVGVIEESTISQFNIFPNPSNGVFNVTFNTAVKSNYKVTVVNTLGQVVYEEVLNSFNGSYSKQLNLEQYGKGMFMVNIADGENSATRRAVVY